MSNREIVIELLSKLPEDAPLKDIAHEIETLADMQTAREQGRYREGIPAKDARRLPDDEDRLREEPLAEVRRKIQIGIDQLDRGEGIPGGQVLAEVRKKSADFRLAQHGE